MPITDVLGDPLGPLADEPADNDSTAPLADSLADALYLRFAADAGLVSAFGHDDDGPVKFWIDEVASGDGDTAGVIVPPPYVVASVLGSGPAGVTFGRGYTRNVAVLLKTFATTRAEADRLGGLVSAALLDPSLGREPLLWVGGAESASQPLDDRTTTIPGRGGPGGKLYGRYSRFAVLVSGQF